jgi:hypothetical protein
MIGLRETFWQVAHLRLGVKRRLEAFGSWLAAFTHA